MRGRMLFVLLTSALILSSCGSGEPVGSSISIYITEPATTSDVSVSTSVIATIDDPEEIGLTMPATWGDVFTLRAIGSETNLCESYQVEMPTVTCNHAGLQVSTQYTISVSGVADANGNRIDPAALAFQTSTSPYDAQ